MYILRHTLPLLLLITFTPAYPPRYARRRRQFARPWLELPGSDSGIAGQPSQAGTGAFEAALVATDAGAKHGGTVEMVVKTVVETVIVAAAISSEEGGSGDG